MHKLGDLKIWKKAMELTEDIYELTSHFPEEEKYGLTSQLRRCAVSIPSNIAEGAGRNHKKEFRQFLAIASGSSYEVETQLKLAVRLGFTREDQVADTLKLVDEIQKMNYSLQRSIPSESLDAFEPTPSQY